MRKELRQHVGGGALLFCLHQMALLYRSFSPFCRLWSPAICHLNGLFWSMTSWMKVIMSHHCVTLDFNKYTQLYRRNVWHCFRSSTIITLIYFEHIQYQLWKGILNAKLNLNQTNTTSYNWSISKYLKKHFWQVRICQHVQIPHGFCHIFSMETRCVYFFPPDGFASEKLHQVAAPIPCKARRNHIACAALEDRTNNFWTLNSG